MRVERLEDRPPDSVIDRGGDQFIRHHGIGDAVQQPRGIGDPGAEGAAQGEFARAGSSLDEDDAGAGPPRQRDQPLQLRRVDGVLGHGDGRHALGRKSGLEHRHVLAADRADAMGGEQNVGGVDHAHGRGVANHRRAAGSKSRGMQQFRGAVHDGAIRRKRSPIRVARAGAKSWAGRHHATAHPRRTAGIAHHRQSGPQRAWWIVVVDAAQHAERRDQHRTLVVHRQPHQAGLERCQHALHQANPGLEPADPGGVPGLGRRETDAQDGQVAEFRLPGIMRLMFDRSRDEPAQYRGIERGFGPAFPAGGASGTPIDQGPSVSRHQQRPRVPRHQQRPRVP